MHNKQCSKLDEHNNYNTRKKLVPGEPKIRVDLGAGKTFSDVMDEFDYRYQVYVGPMNGVFLTPDI